MLNEAKRFEVKGKTPPQALDLEESVLGALLLEKEALTEVIDLLKPDSFYHDAHQNIYRAICQLFNETQPVDIRTVVHQLRKDGKLEKVGGSAYIAQLTNSVASSAHILTHAHIIVEYAIRRALISISSKVQTDAYNDSIDTFALLDKAEQAFFEVSDSNVRKSYTDINNLLRVALKNLEERKNKKDGLVGIPTGFSGLDRLLFGLQKSDLIIVAGRPGMGKTSLMLNILCNIAIRYQQPAAFFSLEMSAQQVTNRIMSAEMSLGNDKIKKANLKDYEWEQIFAKSNTISQAPIYIDHTPAISLFEFRAKCRRLKAKHGIKLIAVDYLQLMTAQIGGRRNFNREQEISSISSGLKAVAKELDVPIVVGSQLSRSVETRGGVKRPMLSDLRESGAIEQDADIVMFLYRPEYYGITEDENGHATHGLAELIIAKHRNGALGRVNLKYTSELTKFSNFKEQNPPINGYF